MAPARPTIDQADAIFSLCDFSSKGYVFHHFTLMLSVPPFTKSLCEMR